MAKRILIVWELGGARGHRVRLESVIGALLDRGHAPVLAFQQPQDVANWRPEVRQLELHQSPRWPAWQTETGRLQETSRTGSSMTDRLRRFGLASPEAAKAVFSGWDKLIAAVAPDLIFADYAPACLAVARGRVPTIAAGDGFTLPPSHLPEFPPLLPDQPLSADPDVLDPVNAALRALGRPALNRLPELFIADRACVATFAELDPYNAVRSEAVIAPWLPDWSAVAQTEPSELFVYLSLLRSAQPVILTALTAVAAAGTPVRLYATRLAAEEVAQLRAAGIQVEAEPVPLEAIQRRTRMTVSYGSHGLMCAMLASGVPSFVIPISLSTAINGKAIERIGAGRSAEINPRGPFEPALLAQLIQETMRNTEIAETAKRLAPGFERRLSPRPSEVVADYVEALI